MEPVCGNRPEGSRCERRCPGNRTRREAKASQRCPKSPHAGAERHPRDPSRVPESPTGFSGRLATEASRAGWYRPRVAEQAPAYPSHLAGVSAGRTARATTPAGRTDEPSIKAASRPQAKGALAEVMGHQVRKAVGRGNEAFTLVAAVSGARSLPGSHVPAQEGLPQGRGRYRGRRGGAGAPCRGAWEVARALRWPVPDSLAGGLWPWLGFRDDG